MHPITESQMRQHLHRIRIPEVVHDDLPIESIAEVVHKDDVWSFIFRQKLQEINAYLERNGIK